MGRMITFMGQTKKIAYPGCVSCGNRKEQSACDACKFEDKWVPKHT